MQQELWVSVACRCMLQNFSTDPNLGKLPKECGEHFQKINRPALSGGVYEMAIFQSPNKYLSEADIFSMAMPADSRCETRV